MFDGSGETDGQQWETFGWRPVVAWDEDGYALVIGTSGRLVTVASYARAEGLTFTCVVVPEPPTDT